MSIDPQPMPQDSVLIRYYRNLFTYASVADTVNAQKEGHDLVQQAQNLPVYNPPNLTKFMRGDLKKRGVPANKCIYCGSEKYEEGTDDKLSDEHIISEALEARYVVEFACCKKCQTAINSYEGQVLNELFGAANRRMGFLGKKTQVRKSKYRVKALLNGQERVLNIPLPEHPTMLFLMRLALPGILCGRPKDNNGLPSGWTLVMNQHDAMVEKGMPQFTSPQLDSVHFCRFLAKIGHGFAVGMLGLEGFNPFLCEPITRQYAGGPDIWLDRYHYVGGDPTDFAPSDALHEMNIQILPIHGKQLVVVGVRLYAILGAPLYYVVVGDLTRKVLSNAGALSTMFPTSVVAMSAAEATAALRARCRQVKIHEI